MWTLPLRTFRTSLCFIRTARNLRYLDISFNSYEKITSWSTRCIHLTVVRPKVILMVTWWIRCHYLFGSCSPKYHLLLSLSRSFVFVIGVVFFLRFLPAKQPSSDYKFLLYSTLVETNPSSKLLQKKSNWLDDGFTRLQLHISFTIVHKLTISSIGF